MCIPVYMKSLKSLEGIVNTFKSAKNKLSDITNYLPNFRTFGYAALLTASLGLSSIAARAGTWSDDFSDGVIGSRWAIQDNLPSMIESNGKLSLSVSSPGADRIITDAFYTGDQLLLAEFDYIAPIAGSNYGVELNDGTNTFQLRLQAGISPHYRFLKNGSTIGSPIIASGTATTFNLRLQKSGIILSASVAEDGIYQPFSTTDVINSSNDARVYGDGNPFSYFVRDFSWSGQNIPDIVNGGDVPTPTPTATNTPVPPTATFTETPTPIPPTATFTETPTPVPPTATFTETPTLVPPTDTPTATVTPVPPTATFTETPTPIPPTATFTETPTPVPPTATFTETPTLVPSTDTPTATPIPPTATFTETPTLIPQTATFTSTPSYTSTHTTTPVPPTYTSTPTPTNNRPSINAVWINPSTGCANTIFTSSIIGATDNDNDPVSIIYQWQNSDGSDIVGATESSIDSLLYFQKGSNFKLRAAPYDGKDYGDPKTSSIASVVNSVPVVETAQIVKRNLNSLELLYTANDLDNDSLNHKIRWGYAKDSSFTFTHLPQFDDKSIIVGIPEGQYMAWLIVGDGESETAELELPAIDLQIPTAVKKEQWELYN